MTASNLFPFRPFLQQLTGWRRIASLTVLLPALTVALDAAAPAAAATGPVQSLTVCARMAEEKPDETVLAARQWQQQGGAEQARYCQALALFHQGEFRDAAVLFEQLAPVVAAIEAKSGKGRAEKGKPAMLAEGELLARAGWAWMRAGDPAKAEQLYNDALAKRPGDADLLIDRAFARAETERYWDALDDLDAAIAIDATRADAFLFRASTHRALANDRQALVDLERMLELRPGDPDALLLRGSIRMQAGDVDGARSDWRMVVRSSPDSEAGESAARNLERLEALQGQPGEGKPKR